MNPIAIEEQIRTILAEEQHAIALSDQLFSPQGLFAQMASSEEDRRALVQTPLFREAQQRLTELQKAERAELLTAVQRTRGLPTPQSTTNGNGESNGSEKPLVAARPSAQTPLK